MESKIGVVVPAYNEELVIDETIKSFPDKIKDIPVVLIVVNDGSSDDTASIVSKNRRVHLINHLINFGAGAATRTGINYARELGCKYILTMDADGQHNAEDAVKLVKSIMKGGADFIIGSRLVQPQGMPWYRQLGNKFLNFVTFVILGVWVTDSQSGLKVMTRNAASKITFHSNQYAFCSEMIWRAKRAGLRIKEIPVSAIYTEYSLAKGQSNWGALSIIKHLFKRRILSLLDG